MDIPDLVRQTLGDEEIAAGVSIGDEDAVCLTPTRTLIYRSEGLLSDEQVEEYPHDVERLAVSEGRRKTKFELEYVEGVESFTVPANRGENVLELLLQGILRRDGVIGEREMIAGVYRFTELTLIVTGGRLLKHIGNHVWDEDFEDYPFEDVTGLEFERASNATSIAVEIGGRPQRVKVPNDTARVVRQTIENALFAYYDVGSLEALNGVVGERSGGVDDADTPEDGGDRTGDIGFESGIDPLVTDSDAEDENENENEDDDPLTAAGVDSDPQSGGSAGSQASVDTGSDGPPETASSEATDTDPTADARGEVPERMDVSMSNRADAGEATDETASSESASERATGEQTSSERDTTTGEREPSTEPTATESESDPASDTEPEPAPDAGSGDAEQSVAPAQTEDALAESPETATAEYEPASREELRAVTEQVEELTAAVDRQNELLKRQHKAIKQLVRELQSE